MKSDFTPIQLEDGEFAIRSLSVDVDLNSQIALCKSLNDMAAENGRLKEEVDRLSSGGFSMEQAIACGFTVDEIYKEEKKEYEEKITSLTAENARLVSALEVCQKTLAESKHFGLSHPDDDDALEIANAALAKNNHPTPSRDEGKDEAFKKLVAYAECEAAGLQGDDIWPTVCRKHGWDGEQGYFPFLASLRTAALESAARFLEGE